MMMTYRTFITTGKSNCKIKNARGSACKISGKIEMSHHVFSWWLFDTQKAKKSPARGGAVKSFSL